MNGKILLLLLIFEQDCSIQVLLHTALNYVIMLTINKSLQSLQNLNSRSEI